MRMHWVLAIVGAAALAANLSACGGGQPAAAAGTQPATAPAASGPADPNNLIIGRWLFISANNNPAVAPGGCSTEMMFTPTQWTIVQMGVTKTDNNVHYYASAKEVYVVDADGGHVTYNVLDPNHVQLDNFTMCTYARAA